jgi:hypothetical protein
MQTVIFDLWSQGKASCFPILPLCSFVLISMAKLWDMIIRLCMSKGQTHHLNVLESKSGCKMAITFGFFLQVTVKWQSKSSISNEMCKQNLSECCHRCHRKSVKCAWQIDLNDNHHAAFINSYNSMTLRTDLVHMVEIFEIACGMSWKSRRMSWIRNGEEVELYLPKPTEMIYMPSIASRKRRNLAGPCHFSVR